MMQKLFLRVDKIAVKKLGKTQEGIIEKRPIVRMIADCGRHSQSLAE